MERCFPAKSHSCFKWNVLCLESEMVAMSSWFAAWILLLSPLRMCHAGQSSSEDYEKPQELSSSRGVSAICFFCPVLTMLQISEIIKREELAEQRKNQTNKEGPDFQQRVRNLFSFQQKHWNTHWRADWTNRPSFTKHRREINRNK